MIIDFIYFISANLFFSDFILCIFFNILSFNEVFSQK